jgi:hypothetical protein
VVSFVEARRNPIMAVLDVPLMYSLHTALAAERWRRDYGAAVRVGERRGRAEALLSFRPTARAPDDHCPKSPKAWLRRHCLGHPLIRAAQCVCNDVSLGGKPCAARERVEMAKSTLLRTVGINTVLAMAGAL